MDGVSEGENHPRKVLVKSLEEVSRSVYLLFRINDAIARPDLCRYV